MAERRSWSHETDCDCARRCSHLPNEACERCAGTLVGFLLARIAEDEAAADRSIQLSLPHGSGLVSFGSKDAPLVLIHTPARVLAECQAKRRIVDHYTANLWQNPGADRAEWGASCEPAATIMRELAAVYADHPDYREEWRP